MGVPCPYRTLHLWLVKVEEIWDVILKLREVPVYITSPVSLLCQ